MVESLSSTFAIEIATLHRTLGQKVNGWARMLSCHDTLSMSFHSHLLLSKTGSVTVAVSYCLRWRAKCHIKVCNLGQGTAKSHKILANDKV